MSFWLNWNSKTLIQRIKKSTKRKKIVSEVEAMRDWGLEDRSDKAIKKSSKKARRTQR